jgi:uncharacterized protein (DUF58 family)
VAAKAAVLRRLELDRTKRLDGMISGEHLTTSAGPGSEPAAARLYGPGDDARRIDWSLTARSLAPHIRTTDADRELRTMLVVDRSASLDFGTAGAEKREIALSAVAAFGFLALRAGYGLGVVITGGEQLVALPVRSGRGALLAALSSVHDTPRMTAAPPERAALSAGLEQVERTQRRRGQVIVVSDFLDGRDWERPLRRLAFRHDVVLVHVTDPRELALPDVGMLSVVDPETGRHLHVHTGSVELRERYAAAATARHAAIRKAAIDSGTRYVHLSTDRDWVLDVVTFLRRHRAERLARRPASVVGATSGAGPRGGR